MARRNRPQKKKKASTRYSPHRQRSKIHARRKLTQKKIFKTRCCRCMRLTKPNVKAVKSEIKPLRMGSIKRGKIGKILSRFHTTRNAVVLYRNPNFVNADNSRMLLNVKRYYRIPIVGSSNTMRLNFIRKCNGESLNSLPISTESITSNVLPKNFTKKEIRQVQYRHQSRRRYQTKRVDKKIKGVNKQSRGIKKKTRVVANRRINGRGRLQNFRVNVRRRGRTTQRPYFSLSNVLLDKDNYTRSKPARHPSPKSK